MMNFKINMGTFIQKAIEDFVFKSKLNKNKL